MQIRSTVVIGLTLCLLAPASAETGAKAAAKKTKLDGTWHWVQDYGQGPVKNWLVLRTNKGKLTGAYVRDEREFPIKDGKLEKGAFSFALQLQHNNKPVDVKCTGKLVKDTLQAKSSVTFKGETTDLEFVAKRSARPADVAGTWKLVIESPDRTFRPQLEVKVDGDKLKAKYVTEEVGTHDVESISLSENKLTFALNLDVEGTQLALKFAGHPRGSDISGEVEYDAGDVSGTLPFQGALSAKPKESNSGEDDNNE